MSQSQTAVQAYRSLLRAAKAVFANDPRMWHGARKQAKLVRRAFGGRGIGFSHPRRPKRLRSFRSPHRRLRTSLSPASPRSSAQSFLQNKDEKDPITVQERIRDAAEARDYLLHELVQVNFDKKRGVHGTTGGPREGSLTTA